MRRENSVRAQLSATETPAEKQESIFGLHKQQFAADRTGKKLNYNQNSSKNRTVRGSDCVWWRWWLTRIAVSDADAER